jgi:hypothetical protein
MLGSRRDTNVSVASTTRDSPPHQRGPLKAACKTVYATEAVKTYERCTRSEAEAYLKRNGAPADEAALIPRVFLQARGLGASPRAIDLLSKVRPVPARATFRPLRARSARARAVSRRSTPADADSRPALPLAPATLARPQSCALIVAGI